MVRFRRNPAGRNDSSSRRYLLWMVACLLIGRVASGQVYQPMAGPGFNPNQVFGSPAAYNEPRPAYGPNAAQGDELLPVYGDQEPGALDRVSYSQPVGDYGYLNISGSPDPDGLGGGASFSINPTSWLYFRDLQVGAYSGPEQTVVNAGTTFTLVSTDKIGLGGRALFGASIDDDLEDQVQFSGDAFAGFRLPGEIWLKGGFSYDTQEDFYKYGPTMGAVFMADAKHPITLDAAYSTGHGRIRQNQGKTGLLGIADDDLQIRLGTYISPSLQLGLSGNFARWDNDIFKDDSGIGGFARVSIADLELTVDVTDGDLGTRGFVNVAYVFGGPHRRSLRDRATCGSGFVDNPQDWLTRPIMRDTSLRVQQVIGAALPAPPQPPGPQPPIPPGPPIPITPLVGNVSQVLCSVSVNPAADQVNPGVVDPGDGFQLIVTLGNGTGTTASNVFVTNIAPSTPLVTLNTPAGEIIAYGDISGSGGQVAMFVPSVSMGVDPSAPQGTSFNIQFTVVSDGVARQFLCPVTLGVTGNATPASPAIAL